LGALPLFVLFEAEARLALSYDHRVIGVNEHKLTRSMALVR